jgi:hypothetical protein
MINLETKMTPLSKSSFWRRPGTRLGWWAFGLAAAFVVMFIINAAVFMPGLAPEQWNRVLLPVYGISMGLCGLAAGVVGSIAVIRRHERSWLV